MDITHERALVEQAKTDPAAFGEIFDAYYPKILNYTARRTGDATAAQDITAETFTKALRKLSTFRWRGISIEAWLFAIATNELRMYFRSQRHHASLEELQECDGFEPMADTDLHLELVEAQNHLERQHTFYRAQHILLTLPIKYQEVIALRFMEGKKISEIAVILKKPDGTIKSLLSRGLGLVRKRLNVQPNARRSIITPEGTKRI
ncbi:MAG TPA: sigma-70 family RNA polymerase sigma factor [Magnetospirillaceae bacterium]|nr:sigma-70 family RNA polymerase sigma factor [Magnetospirillaceae bacterium]